MLSPYAAAGSVARHGWVDTGLPKAVPGVGAATAASGGGLLLPSTPPLWSLFRLALTTAPAPPSFETGVDVPVAPLAALRPPLPPPTPMLIDVDSSLVPGGEDLLAWARGPLAGLVPLAAAPEAAVLRVAVACTCLGTHPFAAFTRNHKVGDAFLRRIEKCLHARQIPNNIPILCFIGPSTHRLHLEINRTVHSDGDDVRVEARHGDHLHTGGSPAHRWLCSVRLLFNWLIPSCFVSFRATLSNKRC